MEGHQRIRSAGTAPPRAWLHSADLHAVAGHGRHRCRGRLAGNRVGARSRRRRLVVAQTGQQLPLRRRSSPGPAHRRPRPLRACIRWPGACRRWALVDRTRHRWACPPWWSAWLGIDAALRGAERAIDLLLLVGKRRYRPADCVQGRWPFELGGEIALRGQRLHVLDLQLRAPVDHGLRAEGGQRDRLCRSGCAGWRPAKAHRAGSAGHVCSRPCAPW